VLLGEHSDWVFGAIGAMRVCNPDCAPLGIHGGAAAPTPSGFAEIVSDYFSVSHASDSAVFAFHTATTKWLFGSCQVAAFSDKLPLWRQK
jgi:hypothetical protein